MRHSNNHYNKHLKLFARELRSETVSRAEKHLWKAVLSKDRTGVRFLRQRPIDRFIVDFFAPQPGLIVEIDGNSHWSKPAYDRYREDRLRSLGYELLRFTEGEVLQDVDTVGKRIVHAVEALRDK